MKKVNFRNALLALVVTLAFVFVGVQQADAQITPALTTMHGGAYNVPTGNFVSSTQAKDMLLSAMLQLKEDEMPQQTGAQLAASVRLVQYYSGIREKLESGNDVPEAIVGGFEAIMGADLSTGPTPSVLNAMKQLAIDLLSI